MGPSRKLPKQQTATTANVEITKRGKIQKQGKYCRATKKYYTRTKTKRRGPIYITGDVRRESNTSNTPRKEYTYPNRRRNSHPHDKAVIQPARTTNRKIQRKGGDSLIKDAPSRRPEIPTAHPVDLDLWHRPRSAS